MQPRVIVRWWRDWSISHRSKGRESSDDLEVRSWKGTAAGFHSTATDGPTKNTHHWAEADLWGLRSYNSKEQLQGPPTPPSNRLSHLVLLIWSSSWKPTGLNADECWHYCSSGSPQCCNVAVVLQHIPSLHIINNLPVFQGVLGQRETQYRECFPALLVSAGKPEWRIWAIPTLCPWENTGTYRPLGLISIPRKIMEKILLSHQWPFEFVFLPLPPCRLYHLAVYAFQIHSIVPSTLKRLIHLSYYKLKCVAFSFSTVFLKYRFPS